MRSRVLAVAAVGLLLMTFVGPISGQESRSETADFDPDQVTLSLEVVAEGFTAPVHVTNAGDGSGRLFVSERAGVIWIIQDGKRLPEPFLDISDIVRPTDMEQSFGAIAFSPNYQENGYFYAVYTKEPDGANVLARFQVSADDPNRADPDSLEELIVLEDRFPNHNGGDLAFGPDGYLFVATGDEGGEGDPKGNAQDGQRLFGKVLRLDVDHGDPYAIPPDNPYVDDPDVRDEIWAMGMRNPFRFGFDADTGDLYIADVGENSWEEVNFVPTGTPGGMNFGWNVMEGFHCYPEDAQCDQEGYWLPVLEYSHEGAAGEREGCSIVGGRVYRGEETPYLDGVYVFGDWCEGRIFAAWRDGDDEWQRHELLDTFIMMTSIGNDEQGELYLTDMLGGTLQRLVFDAPDVEPAPEPTPTAVPDPTATPLDPTAGGQAFAEMWQGTEQAVLDTDVKRTWLWGPEPLSDPTATTNADGNEQLVQWFDKGRMELATDVDGSAVVTRAPIVKDLLEHGDEIPIAGDPDTENPVTYLAFANLVGHTPFEQGQVITTVLQPDGEFADMPVLASQNVTAGILNEDTGHRVASVFEEFLNQVGSTGSDEQQGPLFTNPLEEVGAPLTDAYWVRAVVKGEERLVLVQPFEKLVLTYTPDNPDGWQVELGNAGRHAFQIQAD